jgi:murein DD-endopeptidase MepM/ murein hydrolase activator NlpD
MLTGFGEADFGQPYGSHAGIDIYINGQGGQPVRAARAGFVVINNGEDGGYVVVAVPMGGGRYEYDGYMHVMNRVAPMPVPGYPFLAPITEGQAIGQISNTYFPAVDRHLHFEVQSALPPPVDRPNFHN